MSGHKPRAEPSRKRQIALRVSGFVLDYLVALPAGCLLALAWVNTLPETYFQFAYAASFVVNDIGMAFFLGLITKEVAEATLPGGALHPWRRAAVPVVGAFGGALLSIASYFLFLQYADEPILMMGWVASCAIDIAGTYVVARLIFGQHAAVPFLLLLAMASDAIGLILVALLHPVGDSLPLVALAMMAVAIGGAAFLRSRGVMSFWWYLVGPGVLSWWALFLGGVHPALALVPIVPFFPHGQRDRGLLVEPAPQAHDTMSLFERWWRVPVEGVLFMFGLVNAGVPFFGLELGTLAIPAAALARPIGIVAGVGLAIGAGLHLPRHVGWKELAVVAMTASIGLVFALFFATAVMPPGPLLLEMKMGSLLTIGGAVLAFGLAWVLKVGRFAR